mmetsp:Transcript_27377/g.69658  ORF Transcript_27377/g.69658 Transcript_27377/m.69658 type:complete len:206 (+) Transcript_27377:34-651(+)|eukprot:CAMPEP_0115865320 /NCGR_PEP_ID=MMETSP0287-20121206/19660_1 /TAXON_ID=412157 /ORGANISM="Chrysochromulina rotalis, Strain UIO044" /LENGTH=205 /DNA_ID=CAMNT_0003319827 /DNA_START=31 /DNA_END=648 /DNA_ORIENTATION=-
MRRTFFATTALMIGTVSAFGVASRPTLSCFTSQSRSSSVRCGFEVEEMEQKALDELGVFNWPNLEKRSAEFAKSATADELLMVYVKDGSAKLADNAETTTVSAGQLVMVNDGEVRWSELGDGVTLLSVVTAMENDGSLVDDNLADEANTLKANIAKSLTGSTRGLSGSSTQEEDVSLVEYGGLLMAGLIAGVLLSTGLKLILSDP